jgi:hypothetical protein
MLKIRVRYGTMYITWACLNSEKDKIVFISQFIKLIYNSIILTD